MAKQSNQTQDSPDWIITTKVKESILTDSKLTDGSRFVSVTTNDGVVMISGTVASKKDMWRIVRLAKKVSGVKKVDNQMSVGS